MILIFDIKKDSIVYVLCPAHIVTGGPEAIHQLCDALDYFGIDCRIAYIYFEDPQNKSCRLNPKGKPQEFNIYNTKEAEEIIDDVKNVLIMPEHYLTSNVYEVARRVVRNFKYIQKGLWWLASYNEKYHKIDEVKGFIHLVQSFFAKKKLEEIGLESYYLSDYTSEIFIESAKKGINLYRENLVLFNPSKGFERSVKIIDLLKKKRSDIKIGAIQGLSKSDMVKLFSVAKVYFDFGEHPGKDRIPRETAVMGMTVLVGLDGSAKYFRDIPISNKYKMEYSDENLEKIVDKIIEMHDNYLNIIDDFKDYREAIFKEKENFYKEVEEIFVKKSIV